MGLKEVLSKSVFGFKKKNTEEVTIINGVPMEESLKRYESDQKKQKAYMKDESGKAETGRESRNLPDESEDMETVAEIIPMADGRLPKIDRYWDHLMASKKGKRTIQEYKYEYAWWSDQTTQIKRNQKTKKSVYYLNVSEMESILKDMHPCTARRKASFLRNLGKWYLREGKNRLYMETNKYPSPKLPERLPGDHGKEKFEIIREEAKQLCAKGERVGVWIGLMLMCGLRVSEIHTTIVKDKDYIIVMGKGNKERIIPAPQWLLDAMGRVKREGRSGWIKKRITVYRGVKARGYKPHSLRHTYASELIREGYRIEKIRVLMGHADISTTSIYANIDISTDSVRLLDR